MSLLEHTMPPKRKDQTWQHLAERYYRLWQMTDVDAQKWQSLVKMLQDDIEPSHYHCES